MIGRTTAAVPASPALACLAVLARRGLVAEIAVAADGTRVVDIVDPGPSRAVRRGRIPWASFRDACDAGWLVPVDTDGVRYVLSPVARRLLRRLKSAGEPSASNGRSDRSSTPPVTAAAAPVAPASKRAAKRAAAARAAASPRPNSIPTLQPMPRDVPLVDPAESPLSWMRRHKTRAGAPLISSIQFEAGERLRADLWRARMSPRLTVDWDRIGDGGVGGTPGRPVRSADAEASDIASSAAERVRRALTSVGPVSAGLLIDVCGHLVGLEEIERRRGWPLRSGKIALQFALSELARHYRLPGVDGGSELVVARLRAWHAT